MGDKKTIGVILSGAGYLDGAEIHESVLCLLALDEAGAEVRIFAPDAELDEVDHKSSEATGNKRNVLVEAARIARGKVADVSTVQGSEVDGWVLPGGYGAAKNLCDFAVKGSDAKAHPEVARVVREALAAHVPVGACCIAPALLAVITKSSGPHLKLTIGNDPDTAKALTSMGATHVDSPVDEAVVDADHKVVTAPAYMYGGAPIADVAKGIRKMVDQVIDWA
jgi:enhancing lycopene biosynthesis protein 2